MPQSYTTCPNDGEPLVTSMEVRGFEWKCMTCGNYYEFFGTTEAPATPQMDARYQELLALKLGEA